MLTSHKKKYYVFITLQRGAQTDILDQDNVDAATWAATADIIDLLKAHKVSKGTLPRQPQSTDSVSALSTGDVITLEQLTLEGGAFSFPYFSYIYNTEADPSD